MADGLHARTDGFTSLAVVVGALVVLAGYPLADPVDGILITAAILVVLRGAVTDIGRRLMDAVDPALVDTAEASLSAVPGVVAVEGLKLRWMGHHMRAEAALLVDPTLSVVDGHEIAVAAHHRLVHDVPRLVDATVHVSPTGTQGTEQHQVLAHHHWPRPEDTAASSNTLGEPGPARTPAAGSATWASLPPVPLVEASVPVRLPGDPGDTERPFRAGGGRSQRSVGQTSNSCGSMPTA